MPEGEDRTPAIKTVGRYQIIEELGRGAMAVVYKGKDPVIGRTVALKTLLFRDDNKEMRDLRAALYRDACAAGTLAHPNIVTIYDVIEEAGMTAVAMEFIEGRTLDAIIKEKAPLPIDMALGLFDQIVAGLDYAHTKGIIHRDIKPANIMLTSDGRVKVTDFGVARVTSAGATMTATVVGSPSYMSPEQIRGGKLDGRSDLFSAATVLYEMLTKSRPFPGDDIATTLYRIVHELPTPPAEFNPAIGPELTRVFERAMAKDANERYPTGAELAKAMRQAGGPESGKSSAKVSPAALGATVKIAAAAAAAPAAKGAPAAAKGERAAAAEPVAAVPAPSKGTPMALMAGAAAAVVILGIGGYVFFGRGGAEPPFGQAAQVTTIPPQPTPLPTTTPETSAAPITSGTGAGGSAPQQPAAAGPVTEPPVTNVAAAPARGTASVPPPSRRGGVAPSATSASGRTTRGSQPPATAAPSQPAGGEPAPAPTGTAAPTIPAPVVETPVRTAPPPEAAAAPPTPAAARVTVRLDVGNSAYTGLVITFDSRRIDGQELPIVLSGVQAGPHEVTYRWTSGALMGKTINSTVNLRAGGSNRFRIQPNPNDSEITATPLN